VRGQPTTFELRLEKGQRALGHRSGVSLEAKVTEGQCGRGRCCSDSGESREGGREDPEEGERALQQRKLLGADKAAQQQEGLKLRGARWGGQREMGRGEEERAEGKSPGPRR
jgi:hypothetical protein